MSVRQCRRVYRENYAREIYLHCSFLALRNSLPATASMIPRRMTRAAEDAEAIIVGGWREGLGGGGKEDEPAT